MKGRKLAALLCLILAFSFAFSGCSSKSNTEPTTEAVTASADTKDTESKSDDSTDTDGSTVAELTDAPTEESSATDTTGDTTTADTTETDTADTTADTTETDTADTTEAASATDADDTGESEDEDYSSFNLADYSIEVTPGQYKGLITTKEEVVITEEDIDYEVDAFCESYSEEYEVTDRPCELGDIVYIDYTGTVDGEEFEGNSGEDEEFYLGQGTSVDGFDESIVGHSVGDSFSFEVLFPESGLGNPDLANKMVKFDVTLNSIIGYTIPEFSDEFVAENTDYQTVEEYRAYILEYLTEEAVSDAEAEAEQAIYDTAIANATYTGQIDEAVEASYNEAIDYYEMVANSYYGVDAETLFLYMYGLDADGYHDMIREQAEYSVKFTLLLDKIVEEEALSLTEEEYQERYKDIFFDQYGFESEEEVAAEFTETEIQDIVGNGALREKAEKLILDSAIIN